MNPASPQPTTVATGTERQLPDSASISYAQLCVADSGQALRFYRDLLGLVETRTEWPYRNGQLEMGTEPLNLEDLLSELAEPAENTFSCPQGVSIGHIHLQVSSLRTAEECYHEALGFDVTQRNFPGALFLSAGGYHHHLGVNVWNSRGVFPAPAHSRGLTRFGIHLGNEQALRSLAEQLRSTPFWVKDSIDGFVVRDGDNIHIDIT